MKLNGWLDGKKLLAQQAKEVVLHLELEQTLVWQAFIQWLSGQKQVEEENN